MKNSISKITGYVLIGLSIIVVAVVIYKNSLTMQVPVIFSTRDMISSIWSEYKENYFEKGTMRTLDTSRNNITTSEAQSYAMLRAVWMDDHVTFDGSWQWAKDNLQQDDSALFSWLFGQRPDGTYGILTNLNGQNAASDADIDIAVALLFASNRWRDEKYSAEALRIIDDIWRKEIVIIGGKPYLASDDTEHAGNTVVINPSYFAPYAFRMFADVDPDKTHDWLAVVDTSYEVLEKVVTDKLDKSKSANLPPDWVIISKTNGVISATGDERYTTNYSYDALRVPWRLMLDYKWYKEKRAEDLLFKMSFLTKEWKTNGILHSEYAHDGKIVQRGEVPAMYAGSLPVLMVTDNNAAQKMYEEKLISLFNPDTQAWRMPIGYYNENWAWFSIALYNNFLTNLWTGDSVRPAIPH